MKASPEIVEEAARWSALLDSDHVPQQQRAACEAWCARDPLHRQVFDRMHAFALSIESLGDSERRTLKRLGAQVRRSRQRKTLLGLAVLVLAGWWGSQSYLARQAWPDYRTARGELRTLMLEDASRLIIDTDSSVSVAMESGERKVALFQGRLFVTVARDAQRPFSVQTREGTITALGTAFMVTRNARGTEVEVTESRVLACAANRSECLELGPGERVRIDADGIEALGASVRRSAPDWTSGWLEVDDQALPEVLTQLNRYMQHPVRFDARELAPLRITGSYPLDDPERAVAAMARHLALRLEHLPAGGMVLTSRP